MTNDELKNQKITNSAEMQTPNTVNTEVQESVQANNPWWKIGTTQPTETTTVQTTTPTTQQTTQSVQTANQGTTQPTQEYVNTYNVTQQEASAKAQAVEPVQNQSNTAVKVPTDLYDQTVQNYLQDYYNGQNINDYQAQINALNAIDNYRISQGYNKIYTTNVYELTNQRVAKIKNQIRDYETDMATAITDGDEELAQEIGRQMEEYKKMVNYTDTIDNSATFLQNLEYQSTYDTVIKDIVNELLTAQFTYDPSDDEALLKAQTYATNTVYESMNSKGILDSTMTSAIVTKTVNELLPVYEKMAKEEFYENIERLQTMANFVINLDNNQYERWANQVQLKLDYYDARKSEISYQWERVENLGYVDNEASIVLGVAPGTMSPSTRKAIQEAELEATEQYNKLLTDIQLAEATEAISNGHKVIQDDGSINVQSSMLSNKSSSSTFSTTKTNGLNIANGSNSSDSTGTENNGFIKYEGATANKKNSIVNAYAIGARSASQTLGDAIYNSIDEKTGELNNADLEAILYATFKGNETDATYQTALDNMSKALADEIESAYGEITEDNVDNALTTAVNLYDSLFMFTGSDTVFDKLTDDIQARVSKNTKTKADNQSFETLEKGYETYYDDLISNANQFKSKKELKEIFNDLERKSTSLEKDKEKLIKVYGTTKVNALITMVEQKEDELAKILKNKGVDW